MSGGGDGLVLADGTALGDLIDPDRRAIAARIHADDEIHRHELERVWARSWVGVAHESELREPGDFVTRTVGRDPVIVTRDFDGGLRVLLNVCTHRGAPVCRADVGNARVHTCPFHGWAFGADGALRGVPFERSVYGDRLDRAALGLVEARVATCAGVVFANWDEAAPTLAEDLGAMAWYLEAMLERTDAGLEVTGPPQRSVVRANWKVIADGFFGDSYHVPTVHNRGFVDIGLMHFDDRPLHNRKVSVNGHGLLCSDLERAGLVGDPFEVLAKAPPAGVPVAMLDQLARNLAPEQVEFISRTPPMILGLYPATVLLMIPITPVGSTASLRFLVPLGPDRTEILSLTLVERGAPPVDRDRLHRSTAGSFGVAGCFEPDDTVVWEGVQAGLAGTVARRMWAGYQAAAEPLDEGLPGTTWRGISSDDNQWRFFGRWFADLARPPA